MTDYRSKYNIVTLSGSMSFYDEILNQAELLSMDGYLVLIPFKDKDEKNITDERKKMHEEIHQQRIRMSHQLFVINKGGYVGKSTRNEIMYAMDIGIPIRFMESICHNQWEGYLKDIIRDDEVIVHNKGTIGMMLNNLMYAIMKHVDLVRDDKYNFITASSEIHILQKDLDALIDALISRMKNTNINVFEELYKLKVNCFDHILELLHDMHKPIPKEVFASVSLETLLYFTPSELIDIFSGEK